MHCRTRDRSSTKRAVLDRSPTFKSYGPNISALEGLVQRCKVETATYTLNAKGDLRTTDQHHKEGRCYIGA